jgi:hypothetical protein
VMNAFCLALIYQRVISLNISDSADINLTAVILLFSRTVDVVVYQQIGYKDCSTRVEPYGS